MMTIHDQIADEIQPLGGFLRCESCGYSQELGSVSHCLATGWPRCCGYTMRWWTQRQINAGEVEPPPWYTAEKGGT